MFSLLVKALHAMQYNDDRDVQINAAQKPDASYFLHDFYIMCC